MDDSHGIDEVEKEQSKKLKANVADTTEKLTDTPTDSEARKRPVAESISGPLLRLKNKPSTFSSWDQRYLSVDPAKECLHFFPSEKERYLMPLQTVPLAHINKVQAVDQFSLQIIVKGKPETVIFLRAASGEEKMRWVHSLDLFSRELKSYESWLVLSRMTHTPSVRPREGFLRKLKRNPGPAFLSAWNKRYFRINTEEFTLDYFSHKPTDSTKDEDRRSILLNNIVEVRSIDPWTFQLEVKEDTQTGTQVEPSPARSPSKRQLEKQLSSRQSGNTSYFSLQAPTQQEHTEWKDVLDGYLVDLAMYRECKFLGDEHR